MTGLTPHYAFYGWDCVDPTDHNLDVDSLIPAGPIRFAEELRNEARRRNSLIKQCKVIAAQHMKHTYDRSIAALPELQKGDLVLIDSHNHPGSSKTMRSFKVRKSGPFHIHTVDKHHCVLADMNGRILPDLYPIRKLQKIDGYRDTFPADMVNVNMVDDACIESAEQPVAVDTLSSHARVTALDDSVCDMGNRIDDACRAYECWGDASHSCTSTCFVWWRQWDRLRFPAALWWRFTYSYTRRRNGSDKEFGWRHRQLPKLRV